MVPRVVGLVGLLLLGGLAGCLGDEPAPEPTPPPTEPPAPAVSFEAPINVSREASGAEPVVAEASDGTLFLQAVGYTSDARSPNTLWRSTDGGTNWEALDLPEMAATASRDGFVAVGPDDTVYVANAHAAAAPAGVNTLFLYRSPDLGETWTQITPVQVPDRPHRMWLHPEEGGRLHLLVATLPTTLGLAGDQPLYHLLSEDRGDSWWPPVVVHPSRSLGTPLVIDPTDGSLHTAILLRDPEPRWALFSSTDDGLSWDQQPIAEIETQMDGIWNALSIDPNGTLYLTWTERRDERPLTLYTHGTPEADWATPEAMAPANGSQMLPWSQATAPGQLDALWYTTEARGQPGGFDAPWRIEHVRLIGADTGDATLERQIVTPTPIHQGDICIGASCAQEGADRSLLDYTWITQGNAGDLHLAFTSTIDHDQPRGFPVYAHGRLTADGGVGDGASGEAMGR